MVLYSASAIKWKRRKGRNGTQIWSISKIFRMEITKRSRFAKSTKRLDGPFLQWTISLKIWSSCWTQWSEWSSLWSSILLGATLSQARWLISPMQFSFAFSSIPVSWSCFAMLTWKIRALPFSTETIQISILTGSPVRERQLLDPWYSISGSLSWWRLVTSAWGSLSNWRISV